MIICVNALGTFTVFDAIALTTCSTDGAISKANLA